MNSGLFQIWKERQNNYYFCLLINACIQEKHLFLKLKMKNFGRVFFAVILILTLCQTNVEGQALKNAFNKAKGAVSNVANKVKGGEATKDEGKSTAKEEKQGAPSAGPAKAIAPNVKNGVSEIRGYTGLTKEGFEAKMKSMGFVADPNNEFGLNDAYKSKSGGYYLSASFGKRGKALLVRELTKTIVSKKPDLSPLKTNFLDYAKQCAELKAEFENATIDPSGKGSKVNAKNLSDRTSKFLPAFDQFFASKVEGSAFERYSEKDYSYSFNYFYSKAGAMAILSFLVVDETIESQEG